jgi:ribosomal protein S18 acetylase RimI-like enzyme
MVPEIDIRILGADEAKVLSHVSPDVFDGIISQRWTQEFLTDPRHHLAVALHDGVVVGMASAVHYVHPDKAPELWINEVGVAATHHRSGIGRKLLDALFARGRELGCGAAWVATEVSNTAARRLYLSAGGKLEDEVAVVYDFDLGKAGF